MDFDGKLSVQTYESPYGPLLLGEVDARLCLCYWTKAKYASQVVDGLLRQLHLEISGAPKEVVTEAEVQLEEYFMGKRRTFDLPCFLSGTDFQQSVWRTLSQIPYGATISYRSLAEQMGRPMAVRAVASAVGRNPLQLILPCHRVVGAHSELTGYAGGIKVKSALLALEAHVSGNI